MMKVLLLCLAACYAAAFSPVAPARAAGVASRSDAVVMAAKKKGVNPALFATGIAPKTVARGKGRKSFKAGTGEIRDQDGSWKGLKPWLEGQKREQQSVSKFQSLSGSLGSKQGRDSGAGFFFLGGGRSRK